MHIKNLAQFRMLGTILKYMLLEDDTACRLYGKKWSSKQLPYQCYMPFFSNYPMWGIY